MDLRRVSWSGWDVSTSFAARSFRKKSLEWPNPHVFVPDASSRSPGLYPPLRRLDRPAPAAVGGFPAGGQSAAGAGQAWAASGISAFLVLASLPLYLAAGCAVSPGVAAGVLAPPGSRMAMGQPAYRDHGARSGGFRRGPGGGDAGAPGVPPSLRGSAQREDGDGSYLPLLDRLFLGAAGQDDRRVPVHALEGDRLARAARGDRSPGGGGGGESGRAGLVSRSGARSPGAFRTVTWASRATIADCGGPRWEAGSAFRSSSSTTVACWRNG